MITEAPNFLLQLLLVYIVPEEYKYSTATFYETGINNWNFIRHYTE
jgi:hypothetical protein